MPIYPPELHAALSLWERGDHPAAFAALNMATGQPDIRAQALSLQASWLRLLNRHGEALAVAMKAVHLDASLPEPWETIGYLLLHHKKWAQARQLLDMGTATIPGHPTLQAYYAIALAKCGQTELAFEQVLSALHCQPDLREAWIAKIEILFDAGYYDLALRDCERLQNSGLPETAAFFKGAAAFLTGETSLGLGLLASAMKAGWNGGDLTEWNGAEAKGESIVLYHGQGYGDMIMFARYIDAVRERVSDVTLQVQPTMVSLMRASFPALKVVESSSALPTGLTLRCALPCVPTLLKDEFDPFVEKVPYLRADPAKEQIWRERLKALPRPHIGIVWSSPWRMNSPNRVIDFADLSAIVEAIKPHLVSMQMGEEAQWARAAGLFDASAFINDFADSAALISALDLVITLDSAPAHLAGALGKPTWLFLPFSAEWRWLVQREDSLWYPSMRLFRQPRPQDWSAVVRRIRDELLLWLSGDNRVLQPVIWNGSAPLRHPHALTLPGLKD